MSEWAGTAAASADLSVGQRHQPTRHPGEAGGGHVVAAEWRGVSARRVKPTGDQQHVRLEVLPAHTHGRDRSPSPTPDTPGQT